MSNVAAERSSVRFDVAWLDGFLKHVSQRVAAIGVFGILLVCVLTVADVVLRSLFGTTLLGLNEASALLIALAVTACLPAGISGRVTLTIDVLAHHLPETAAHWLRLVGACGLFAFLFILAWQVGLIAWAAGVRNESTMMADIPVAPFFYGVSAGLAICTVIQTVVVARCALEAREAAPRGSTPVIVAILALLLLVLLAAAGIIPLSFLMPWLPANKIVLSLIAFGLMWVVVLGTVPLGAAMGLAGLLGTAIILGREPSLAVMGSEVKNYLMQPSLSVLPLFLLMGAFAAVGGVGSDLYRLAYALVGHRRGGLANATIAGCAAFGALTGSSMATQVTIGRIAMPEMRQRGYSPSLAAGAMAAGGTLGQLVPPGSAMILYCVLAEESVGKMFMGAILPGILAAALYMATVAAWVRIQPAAAPAGPAATWGDVGRFTRDCWGALLLLFVVLGGIYTGVFTELEAGSVGAVGAFVLAVVRGKITRELLWDVMGTTTATICLMYTLLFGTAMLTFMFGIAGLPQFFISIADYFQLTPLNVVFALIVFYLILGTAMDSWTIMVITIPVFVPLIVGYGFDPIWWGIMVIVLMEAGQISPPFGLNIFIMKSIAPDIPLSKVYAGCWPFFFSTLVKVALLMAFPIIVTWLPSKM